MEKLVSLGPKNYISIVKVINNLTKKNKEYKNKKYKIFYIMI